MAPKEGGYRQINKALNICAFEDYLESQQSCLPKLPDVDKLSPRVIRVVGQNPGKVSLQKPFFPRLVAAFVDVITSLQFTLQGTNTFIVGTGYDRMIVDTGQGIPDWADLIAEATTKGNFRISRVLLTHWHGDHTGGVPDLIRMFPELSQHIYKHTPERGTQQPIMDGQVFKTEGATIRAVHAPGHSSDHVCFVLEEEKAMFTGDNVLGHGTTAVEHLGTFMNSLRVMNTHGCEIGYPAHGVTIPNLKAKINGELAGKIQREKQALRALDHANGGRGRVTVEEIVASIYGKMDKSVRKMALEPFMVSIYGEQMIQLFSPLL